MQRSYIFNVLIGGVSIGLTRSYREAQDWVRFSMYQGTKEIIRIPEVG